MIEADGVVGSINQQHLVERDGPTLGFHGGLMLTEFVAVACDILPGVGCVANDRGIVGLVGYETLVECHRLFDDPASGTLLAWLMIKLDPGLRHPIDGLASP